MAIIRVLLSIASFSFALVAGFRTGANLNPIDAFFHNLVQIDTTPGAPIPNNEQYNLLVIGVDDAQSKEAKLQSIWILAFPQNMSKLNLIPIFPSLESPVQNLILAEAFQLHNGKPSQDFWDAMKATDIWWKGYVISDKTDLVKLIDLLDGIKVNGEKLNGDQAVRNIPTWQSDPQTAIEQQQATFEGICKRISARYTSGNEKGPFRRAMNLSTNSATFIGQWVTKISPNKSLDCYFPTFIEIPVRQSIVVP
jgi:hypothetical protein